jgi:peptidoglycan hydrolase-like protein with peptidoglycan-binding domain
MDANYNVDLDPRLFGRDASGKGKSSSTPADATATQQQPASKQQAEKAKSKDAPEYRITEVAIVVPSDGLKKDQPFDIKGKVQPLAGTLTKKKIRIELITRYKDAEDKFATVEADIAGDNTFTGSSKQLFYHDGYQRDKEKPAGAKFTLEAKASSAGAEKEVVSKTVDLPMETSTVILKKGTYDDAWVKGHEATHPKSGKEYVPDNKVKKLQENLITFRFLPQKSDDGFFGDTTEIAVKQLQELAKKPERKKADDVKIVKIDKITFNGSADGIVEEKTEKEISVWLQNNWVKPDPEYRKGDVDDNGVKNKHGERGSDKHHPGSGILDLQKQLTALGAYNGKPDGWFDEKTEAAIKLFQEKASKGELLEKDGKKAEVKEEEKLKGFRDGVGDGVTVEAVKKEADKGRKIAGKLSLSDSVGTGGKNNPEDVKKVKQRLKDLGYPVNTIEGTIDDEAVKAIKLFQIAYQEIETAEDTSNPKMIPFPDGLISKGKKTESNLFSDSPKKYEGPAKGSEKPISSDCQEKINSAKGADKTTWQNISTVWANISPYLPAGSSMTSGYRSADEQKTLLYGFYNTKYKDKIIKKYSKKDWQKYFDLEGKNNADADAKILEMVRACGQKIAAPGSSPHQKGTAIDVGGIGDEKQCRALLWCSIMQPGGSKISKILPEVNGCVHFEFKP